MVEGVVMAALTTFLNTLQMGLGVAPDFEPRRFFRIPEKSLHLSGAGPRPTVEVTDPDAEWVERVQKGDLDAFEALVQRHNRRVYRTLVGLLGDPDQARDAVQDTFLKAFQNLNRFEGRSKFSTWLVSIATNTGLQILRDRRNEESLDTDESGEERFRPRQVRAWTDDPEQLYSKSEIRTLVQQNIMRLPAKYRVVLVLRDLEQLSTGDAAAALGLGIPALKARLLRGRLMLREALAPHFIRGAQEVRR
jgi:RNA polymerase sigma-70 factor (ECF subfamily)